MVPTYQQINRAKYNNFGINQGLKTKKRKLVMIVALLPGLPQLTKIRTQVKHEFS
jgi:hypothetical protein